MNKSLSRERFLEDESSIQSTMSSADVTDVVDSLSDVVGPSASAKKIKIDSSNPKATKKGLAPLWTLYNDTELSSKKLATVATPPCKNCYELKLEIHEDPKKRKGLASYLIVFSTSCN